MLPRNACCHNVKLPDEQTKPNAGQKLYVAKLLDDFGRA